MNFNKRIVVTKDVFSSPSSNNNEDMYAKLSRAMMDEIR